MAKLPICLLISGVVVTALALVFGFVAFPKILRSKINEVRFFYLKNTIYSSETSCKNFYSKSM